MRWGVRKDGKPQGYKSTGRKSTSKKTAKSTSVITKAVSGLKQKQASAARNKAAAKVSQERKAAVKPKNLKLMSNDEIKARTDRLNAEKKLKELTYDVETSESKKAMDSLKKAAGSKAVRVATTAVVGAASVAALAYVGRYVEAKSIYQAAQNGSDAKAIAKTLGKDVSAVEDVIAKQGHVVFNDPMQRAQILQDAAAFAKAAYKKGK